jgi:hypothetical protein
LNARGKYGPESSSVGKGFRLGRDKTTNYGNNGPSSLYFLVQLNNWQMCMSIAELQQSSARGSTLPVYSNVQNTKIIFEVRHPRCVRQIKIKQLAFESQNTHTHTYIYIYTQQTIVNSLHVSASNKPSSGCTSNEKG